MSENVLTLYMYQICHFCIRVQLALGYKKISYKLVRLDFGDDERPVQMVGKKMLPILEISPGEYLCESLDIIKYLDSKYEGSSILPSCKQAKIETLMQECFKVRNGLLIPRVIQADFYELKTDKAKALERNNFEPLLGETLESCYANTSVLLEEIKPFLQQFESLLSTPESVEDSFSYADIVLLPPLICLTLVKGIEFGQKLEHYIKYWTNQAGIKTYFSQAI